MLCREIAIGLVSLALCSATAAAADPPAPASPAPTAKPLAVAPTTSEKKWAGDAVVSRFLEAMKQNANYTAEQKQKAEQSATALRNDESARTATITEAMRELSPAFREGLDLLADDKLEAAAGKLSPLASSADPYLATEAAYYLARTYILQERYEKASGLLVQVTEKSADKSLSVGEAWFLRGLCDTARLNRTEAIQSLERFLKDFPEAPERMRIAAFRQVEQLKLVDDGSLRDVWLRMDFIRRKLMQEDSGEETRKRQVEVVALLDKLIKDAEEREAECECQGDGQPKGDKRGKGQGKGGGKQSGGQGGAPDGQENKETGDNDQTPYGSQARRQYKGPQSPWSTLRDKEREKVFQALEGKYPARYKQLIEQYYKSVQDEDQR